MRPLRTLLTTALTLALSAPVAAPFARAQDAQPLWTSRLSLPLGNESNPALSRIDSRSSSVDSETGIYLDRDGRVRLDMGGSVVNSLNDAFATLPWCAEASGLLRIGALGRDCLMQGMVQLELPGRVASVGAGAQWRGERFDFSLAYGFSWLTPNLGSSFDVPYLPTQDVTPIPSLELQPLPPDLSSDVHGFGVNSQWRLTAQSAIQLDAALRELRLRSGSAIPVLDVQQALLGFGLRYGDFSGNVTGRVNRLNEAAGYPNRYWSGIDIGVSWRTPWRGELTVGARNLVGKTSPDESDVPAAVLSESSARTPYVRYQQDL